VIEEHKLLCQQAGQAAPENYGVGRLESLDSIETGWRSCPFFPQQRPAQTRAPPVKRARRDEHIERPGSVTGSQPPGCG
jgi:hypothetical protein